MDDFDVPIKKNRTGLIVAIVLLGGIGVLAVGGYMVYKRRGGGGETVEVPKGAESWCKLRQSWSSEVKPLAGEIMIKQVQAPDSEALSELVTKRNKACQANAKKLQELLEGDAKLWPVVEPLEQALIREGKVRSNISVEIDNLLTKSSAGTTDELSKHLSQLKIKMDKRIKAGKAKADKEVKATMAALKGVSCSVFYRGPMTDKGTSGNPYITWEELEVRRTLAIKAFQDAIKALEPVEHFTNQVYHDLMRRYSRVLKKCYKKAKAKNPKMSDKLGLRIRLKNNGKVATLAIEWMTNRDERILDCLLETATQWQLPRPSDELNVVTVSLDLSAL